MGGGTARAKTMTITTKYGILFNVILRFFFFSLRTYRFTADSVINVWRYLQDGIRSSIIGSKTPCIRTKTLRRITLSSTHPQGLLLRRLYNSTLEIKKPAALTRTNTRVWMNGRTKKTKTKEEKTNRNSVLWWAHKTATNFSSIFFLCCSSKRRRRCGVMLPTIKCVSSSQFTPPCMFPVNLFYFSDSLHFIIFFR